MKKFLLFVSLITFYGHLKIDGQNLAFVKKDGSIDVKFLVSVKNLTFSGSNIQVNFYDGKSDNYAIGNLSKIYFKSVSTNSEIINEQQFSVSLYPNPASNNLYIKNLLSKELPYLIYGTDGSVKKTGILNQEVNSLDISFLTNGFYVIRINNQALKFIKQ